MCNGDDEGALNGQRHPQLSNTQISPVGGYTNPTADEDIEAASDALFNSRSLEVSIQTLGVGYLSEKVNEMRQSAYTLE